MEIFKPGQREPVITAVGLCGHFEGGFERLYLSEVTGFTFRCLDSEQEQQGGSGSLADPFAAIRYET
jgi:hypothetical protein